MSGCMLCGRKAIVNRQDYASRTIYNCPSCGVFVVSDLAAEAVKKNAGKVSSFLMARKIHNVSDIVLISYEKATQDKSYIQLTVDQITSQFPPLFSQRINLILQNLIHLSPYPGYEIRIEDLSDAPLFYLEEMNLEAMSFAIRYLERQGIVSLNFYDSSFFPCGLVVSPEGWDRIRQSELKSTQEDFALFVTDWKEGIYATKLGTTVRKTNNRCGFLTVNGEDYLTGDKIGYAFIAQVKNSRYLICDITHTSRKAFYAAGMARGMGKQVIFICHKDAEKDLHVEPRDLHVLLWEDMEELEQKLTDSIHAVIL